MRLCKLAFVNWLTIGNWIYNGISGFASGLWDNGHGGTLQGIGNSSVARLQQTPTRNDTVLAFDVVSTGSQANGIQVCVVQTNGLLQLNHGNIVVNILAVPLRVNNDLFDLDYLLVRAGCRLLVATNQSFEQTRINLAYIITKIVKKKLVCPKIENVLKQVNLQKINAMGSSYYPSVRDDWSTANMSVNIGGSVEVTPTHLPREFVLSSVHTANNFAIICRSNSTI